jgi:N-acetylmuramic acid 6-phosphate etherase
MSEFIKVTEQASTYRHLEKMSILELLRISIKKTDRTRCGKKSHSPDRKTGSAITDKMLAMADVCFI